MSFASRFVAFAAGMLAMYYLDGRSGRQRRAVLRDKTWSGARRSIHRSQQEVRHLANQARGVLATGSVTRSSHRPPENDGQLHERVRAQLGHLVSHPRAIHVQVVQGEVTLTGDVLRDEVARLLKGLRDIAGVRRLNNLLTEHASAEHVPALQGSGRPEQPGRKPGAHDEAPVEIGEPAVPVKPQPSSAWH